MKKSISVIYELCFGLAILFLVYLSFSPENELYAANSIEGYVRLVNHRYEVQKDAEAPAGVREIYHIHPSEIPAGSNAFVFYSMHQNVEVYIGDKLALRMKRRADSPIGKSPGNCWNTALITAADQGKEIRVEIQPVYASASGEVPEFYAGSRFSIYMEIIRKDFIPVLFSIVAILLGAGFMIFTFYSYHHVTFHRSLFMMGQFAVLIGVWKLADLGIWSLLTGRGDISSAIVLLALLLLVVPFTQYIREMFTSKDHWIWNAACIVSLGVFVITMCMQITGIADMRQMLWMNHLSMLLLIFIAFPMLYVEVRTAGWKSRLKTMVVCMGSCLMGIVADVVNDYVSENAISTNLGMIGFLIYITVPGVLSLKDARRLMAIGMQAKHLERMAYHDHLTGLYNRAAYADDTEGEEVEPKGAVIVVLDLNNLKCCNDTFGHDKGDLYIISCAQMIQQVFGSCGRCYRVGGDEFCVLLRNKTLQECGTMVRQLKQLTAEWNQMHQEKFVVQIAAGYAIYDPSQDYNISDTIRRADKMMYKDKYQMKQSCMDQKTRSASQRQRA